jgi:competence protein ComEC
MTAERVTGHGRSQSFSLADDTLRVLGWPILWRWTGGVVAEIGGAGPRPGLGGVAAGRSSRRPILDALVHRLEAEQERWFLWLPVAFGGGIALYFALPVEPRLAAATLPVAAALALRLVARGTLATLLTTVLLTAMLGVAAAKLRTEAMRAPVLERQIGPVEVRGFVELIEPRSTRGQRLTLRVSRIAALPPEAWPHRVRVRTMLESADLEPGDAVRLKATLSPPPGPSLPGDYDFARAAWFQGLGGVGYAHAAAETDAEAGEPPLSLRVRAAIALVRQAIGRRVLAALPGQTGAIANALITGERGGISEATNQAFRDSGLFHVLSISGLHMVIMAGAVFFSIRLGLAAIPAIALRYPIKKWAAAGAMAGALGYLLISGAAFATVRSYIMISIMFLAVMLDRPAIALRNVALAALAILLVWPESLFDPGFQMSFAAVVALVSAYEWVRGREAETATGSRRSILRTGLLFLGGIVLSTLVASLAVAPFGIYHFHNTQQFAILANLLAIPICNLVVMPAALAALFALPFGLEAAPLWAMGLGIDAMVWCAQAVAALPGAVGRVPAIPTQAFLLMLAGGLWCALWKTRWRLLGVVPIVAGLVLMPTGRRPDVLVGREAALVAVRAADGRLSAVAGRGSTFELARWLEHDGDSRSPAEAASAAAFRCDAQLCAARVKGLLLAVVGSAAALGDSCAAAAILVLKFARPPGCDPSGVAIDREDVRRNGAFALYVEAGAVRIETVAGNRGDRPWARRPRPGAEDDAAREIANDERPGRGRRER